MVYGGQLVENNALKTYFLFEKVRYSRELYEQLCQRPYLDPLGFPYVKERANGSSVPPSFFIH